VHDADAAVHGKRRCHFLVAFVKVKAVQLKFAEIFLLINLLWRDKKARKKVFQLNFLRVKLFLRFVGWKKLRQINDFSVKTCFGDASQTK
jgi:hypothetical protein